MEGPSGTLRQHQKDPFNPEQSKHLETAKMHIDGIEIDFVNLRSEDYSENSRIPVVVQLKILLEEVGIGIQDLRSRSIATPLPPKQTFLDDPLRVLRAIRFGVRFGFILDEDLKIAASDHDVKAALARKITRDRIAHEVYIFSYLQRIFSVIFSVPHQLELPASEESIVSNDTGRLCVACMSDALRIMQIIEAEDYAFNGCPGAIGHVLPHKKGFLSLQNVSKAVVIHIIRNSLKLKCSDAEAVVSLHNAAEKFMSLIPHIKYAEDIRIAEIDSKVELTDLSGDKLRMLAEIKGFWHAALLLSMLLYPMDVGSSTSEDSQIELNNKRAALFRIIESEIIKLAKEAGGTATASSL
ncbi:hypothetical protein LguiA_026020 [Lonicera macranthoides]